MPQRLNPITRSRGWRAQHFSPSMLGTLGQALLMTLAVFAAVAVVYLPIILLLSFILP